MNRDLFEQKRGQHFGQQQSTIQLPETQKVGESSGEIHPPTHHAEKVIAATREHLEL